MSGDLVSLALFLPGNINTALLTECSVSGPEQLGNLGVEKEEALCQPLGSCPAPLHFQLSLAEFPCSPASPPPQDTQASRRLGKGFWSFLWLCALNSLILCHLPFPRIYLIKRCSWKSFRDTGWSLGKKAIPGSKLNQAKQQKSATGVSD